MSSRQVRYALTTANREQVGSLMRRDQVTTRAAAARRLQRRVEELALLTAGGVAGIADDARIEEALNEARRFRVQETVRRTAHALERRPHVAERVQAILQRLPAHLQDDHGVIALVQAVREHPELEAVLTDQLSSEVRSLVSRDEARARHTERLDEALALCDAFDLQALRRQVEDAHRQLAEGSSTGVLEVVAAVHRAVSAAEQQALAEHVADRLATLWEAENATVVRSDPDHPHAYTVIPPDAALGLSVRVVDGVVHTDPVLIAGQPRATDADLEEVCRSTRRLEGKVAQEVKTSVELLADHRRLPEAVFIPPTAPPRVHKRPATRTKKAIDGS